MNKSFYMRHGEKIVIVCASFPKLTDVVIHNVYYDIRRNIMFNTNSQRNAVSEAYMDCCITVCLNLIYIR